FIYIGVFFFEVGATVFEVHGFLYSVYPFSVLQRCGIRHPKPIPFFGNMMLFRHGFFDAHRDLINQYGRVCGYYLGRRPVVVVADPDMLRQVMVKEFQKFPNRMVGFMLICTFVNTFSDVEMVPLINTATETLLNNLKSYAESGESFDIHRCFGCFTMDVIASVAFGTQVDSQNDPNDPFVHHASKFFSFSFFRPIMFVFMAFPFLIRPHNSIIPNKSRDEMNGFFISCIQKIIKQRDELPPNQRRRDFLQLMLDVRSSKECVSLENFDVVNHADEQAEEQPQRMMTEDEIVGQAFLFLLAGYETSSNTLAFACYLLAINPDCQEKLQREVDDFFTRHGSADYTNVQELKYLDMVVCEALRLYPPGFRFARDVEEDCVINGQFLPKGATLDISAGFLHHDPQYWPEPEKFIPESCVGMRLAQLEIRMALVIIFKKFNVVACEDTKVPLQLKSSTTLGPKNGIFVKITKRLNSDDI
uniref:Thromboxane-A synthase n=1 Tax=Astyanax mexicanus TaxID=7994 RepID=A0A8B9KQ09_ASTMX